MQLEFRKDIHKCLKQVGGGQKRMELTLELRLPEGDPDASNVLGAWGVPVIRTKEWRGDHMGVSGGVNCWVLYKTEDDMAVRCTKGWMPFSFRWELKDSKRDGMVMASCRIWDMDARIVGAGKVMVTAQLLCDGTGLERDEFETAYPSNIPADVHCLSNESEFTVPMEAGEKLIVLDEEVLLPPGKAPLESLLFYTFQPELAEKRLMGDRIACRGTGTLETVYLGTDGRIASFQTELPLSFFAQLDREYGPAGQMWILPVVSELEAEPVDEHKIRVKAGVLAQYTLANGIKLCGAEDLYSPQREVSLERCSVEIPTMGSAQILQMNTAVTMDREYDELVLSAYADSLSVSADDKMLNISGTVRGVGYDESEYAPIRETWNGEMPVEGDDYSVYAVAGTHDDGKISLSVSIGEAPLASQAYSFISGAQLGDEKPEDPDRPSLILCRYSGSGLWQLAKKYGSDADKIREVNRLDAEPEKGQILLIPVC